VQKLLKKFNQGRRSGASADRRHLEKSFAGGLPTRRYAPSPTSCGGFVDNIPRVLPKSLDVVIKKVSWRCCRSSRSSRKRAACRTTNFIKSLTGYRHGGHRVGGQGGRRAEVIKAQKHKAWIIGESSKARAKRALLIPCFLSSSSRASVGGIINWAVTRFVIVVLFRDRACHCRNGQKFHFQKG